MTSENWKSKEFFSIGMTSEEWKKPSFVQWTSEFQRSEKNQDSFGRLLSSKEQQKIKIRFFQFLGIGYIGGFQSLAFSFWVLNIRVYAFGYWTLNILYVSTFGSWVLDIFDFWFLGFRYMVLTFGWVLDI
ncbi:unnamed protein product [Rhizophagus irregularis]|nr:unnamed protein product [Rhizophagus irregularis]